LVELLTGVVFLLILEKYFFVQSGFLTAIFLIIWSTLIAILVYDIKHMIIPDSLVYLFIGLSFFQIILSPSFSIQNIDWLHILAGPILFIPFFLLWLISGGKLIGLGDAKTAWGIGWLVGLQIGFGGIVLAFWIGAVYSIFVLLVKYILSFVDEDNKLYLKLKKFRMKSEIPFAPFLILSLFFVWYFNVDILDLFFLI
jgi:prepilin signal peptidase PulO-like enzyme (type II secretory pathway)